MRNQVSPDFCCKTNPRPCWLTSVPRRVGFVGLKYDSVEGDEEVIKCLLCCCVRWQKFLCSTDSLICPCTYCSMVANYVLDFTMLVGGQPKVVNIWLLFPKRGRGWEFGLVCPLTDCRGWVGWSILPTVTSMPWSLHRGRPVVRVWAGRLGKKRGTLLCEWIARSI